MGPSFWTATLQDRFEELSVDAGAATVLYKGWENASEIIPQVNRLVIGRYINDFQWNPEGCFNRDGLPKHGNGFVDVLKFGQYEPVEGVDIIRLQDYVMAEVSGATPNGTTPVQIVANLLGL